MIIKIDMHKGFIGLITLLATAVIIIFASVFLIEKTVQMPDIQDDVSGQDLSGTPLEEARKVKDILEKRYAQ